MTWWKLESRHLAPDGSTVSVEVPGFPSAASASRFADKSVCNRLISHRGVLHFVTPRAERWIAPPCLVLVDGKPLSDFANPPEWLRDFAVLPAFSSSVAGTYEPTGIDSYISELLRLAFSYPRCNATPLKRQILESYAFRRQGLSRQEVKDRHLDVYPRSDHSIDALFARAVKAELFVDLDGVVVPTLLGRAAELIDTVGADAEAFAAWLDGAVPETPSDLRNEFLRFRAGDRWRTRAEWADAQVGEYIRQQQCPALEAFTGRFLHVNPKLLLRGRSLNEHARKALNVAVFSNDVEVLNGRSLRISRPYPNRNYHVASVDAHGEGWFVSLPDRLEAVTLHVVWGLPTAGLRVAQQIRFHLRTGNGPLFGTACESPLYWHQPYGFVGPPYGCMGDPCPGGTVTLGDLGDMVLDERLRGSTRYLEVGFRDDRHVTTIHDEYVLTGMPCWRWRPEWLLAREAEEWRRRSCEESSGT